MQAQLDFLRSSQNSDGGWGFFPGKQSWLEPTAYALIGLAGAPGFEDSLRARMEADDLLAASRRKLARLRGSSRAALDHFSLRHAALRARRLRSTASAAEWNG